MSISLLTPSIFLSQQAAQSIPADLNQKSSALPEQMSPLDIYLNKTSLRVEQINSCLAKPYKEYSHFRSSTLLHAFEEGTSLTRELEKIRTDLLELILSPIEKEERQIFPIIPDEKEECMLAPTPNVDQASEIHRLTSEIGQILEATTFIEKLNLKRAVHKAETIFRQQSKALEDINSISIDATEEDRQRILDIAIEGTYRAMQIIDLDAGEYYRDNVYECDKIILGSLYILCCKKIVNVSGNILKNIKVQISMKNEDDSEGETWSYRPKFLTEVTNMYFRLRSTIERIDSNPYIKIRPRGLSLESVTYDSPRNRSNSKASIAHSYSPAEGIFSFFNFYLANTDLFLPINIYIHGVIEEEGRFEIRGNGPKMSESEGSIAFDKNILNHAIVNFPIVGVDEDYEFTIVFVTNSGTEIPSKTPSMSFSSLSKGHIIIKF
ncbi:MAG: hypothetical protein FJZ57_04955 [Chlamydiae bacterium]|nr:hypothetical protein [Chlamydiota bacterium]